MMKKSGENVTFHSFFLKNLFISIKSIKFAPILRTTFIYKTNKTNY